MRFLLAIVSVLALLSAVTAIPASAQRTIQIRSISGTPTTINLGAGVIVEDCQVGNLNPAAVGMGGFMLPPEEYTLVFDPTVSCASCPVGFEVTNIHVILQTGAFSYQIEISANIEEAAYPNDPDCPEPGTEWCSSDLVTVELDGAGLWDIIIPVTCSCLTMDRLYLIGFYVNSVTGESGGDPDDPGVPDIVLDAYAPQNCTNWNNTGAGWYDLVDRFSLWNGNLLFFADVTCCSPPVPVEHTTWGAIKELYSN